MLVEQWKIGPNGFARGGLEIADLKLEKERRVAPTALRSFLVFRFPALPRGANLCRASRAGVRRERKSQI